MSPLIAITREVSPSLGDCELSYQTRQPIDVAKAIAQHKSYQDCLAELGLQIVSLPAETELPDAVFVEDAAIVLDEIAIVTRMGAESRRPESASVAVALAPYRPLQFIQPPGTLDGGDVMRVGHKLFVGASRRTNREGIEQLRVALVPYGYAVQAVEMKGCLHLKSACSPVGDDVLLVNKSWVNAEQLGAFELLDVPEDEPHAANALWLEGVVMIPASFPQTRTLLEGRGLSVRTVEVSELQKAEAGVTCCSLIFRAP